MPTEAKNRITIRVHPRFAAAIRNWAHRHGTDISTAIRQLTERSLREDEVIQKAAENPKRIVDGLTDAQRRTITEYAQIPGARENLEAILDFMSVENQFGELNDKRSALRVVQALMDDATMAIEHKQVQIENYKSKLGRIGSATYRTYGKRIDVETANIASLEEELKGYAAERDALKEQLRQMVRRR